MAIMTITGMFVSIAIHFDYRFRLTDTRQLVSFRFENRMSVQEHQN